MKIHGSTNMPRLARTKTGTGDDTDYPAGATVPSDADTWQCGPIAPMGKGKHSEVEFEVLAVDANGVVQAPAGTFSIRVVHILDRSVDTPAGENWPDVAIGTTALTGQAFNTALRVPVNGGKLFFALSSIAGSPGGATAFQVWAKPVAG